MRTEILTFHCADNYGAMLQAYALQRTLERLGCEVGIANFAPPRVTYRYWLIPWFPTRDSLSLKALRTAWRRFKPRLRRYASFRVRRRNMAAFREKYLALSGRGYRSAARFRRENCDMLVLGSDQIWNPGCMDGLCSAYFGAYRAPGVRRVISYAASIGGARLTPPRWEPRFRELLAHVDAVSLREKGSLPFLREMGRDADVCCDPTLLLGAEEWARVAAQPAQPGPYIFVYLFHKDEALDALVTQLKQRTGLPVLCHRASFERRWRDDVEEDLTAGPAEFLGAVMNARYVITNSFHGTAFSVLFHRDFISFPHTTRGLRMLDLLDALGLGDRVGGADRANDIDAPVDWAAVDARLSDLTAHSVSYLREQIALCAQTSPRA